jgi:hypothetical protein
MALALDEMVPDFSMTRSLENAVVTTLGPKYRRSSMIPERIYSARSLVRHALHQVSVANEMDEACSTHDRNEILLQDVSPRTCSQSEDLDVKGRILLQLILQNMWMRFVWLLTECPVAYRFDYSSDPVNFIKCGTRTE